MLPIVIYCLTLISIWTTMTVTRRLGSTLRGQATMRSSNIHAFLGFAVNPIGLAIIVIAGFFFFDWVWTIGYVAGTFIASIPLGPLLIFFLGRNTPLSPLKIVLDAIAILLIILFFLVV